jgi:hypothetical protein
MSFPYKNPISPNQLNGQQSLERTKTYGTSYSTLSTGGFMEVYSLDQLYYTIPPSTFGPIEFSGNAIPITFSKGSGTTFSFDTLTLQPDNISSGRRKIGMLVYVKEVNQIYQYNIDNYFNLFTAATASTGTVVFSDFGTTIKSNSAAGIAFINAWTANTIDGVSGITNTTAVWKKYYGNNLSVTGGSFNTTTRTLTLTNITGGTQNLSGFTDVYVTGSTYSNNTFTYTNNTGGTFSVLFNTITGLTTNGNLSVTGTTTLGNGTFTKAGFATGDVLLDNSGTDTPGVLFYYANNSNYGIDSWNGSFDVLSGQLVRLTNKLNESGGAVKMAIDTSGNLVMTGFIKANAWRAGQVVNDIMLSNTEVTISTTTIATSTSDTDFLTYSYTPLSSNSYLVIHYHLASFSFEGGTGNDSYFSRIKVDGGEITYSRQSTVNGNRTGVLFPLTGRYTNSNTTAKSIVVACRRDSADDNITIVNSSSSMWLRITEIAR